MANKFILVFLFFLALTGCAHEQETQDVELHAVVKGLHVHLNDFLKLTAEDIFAMQDFVNGKTYTDFTLSNHQGATCTAGKCTVKVEQMTLALDAKDLEQFSKLMGKAEATGREQRFRNGPLTQRCRVNVCMVDFNYDDDKKHDFKIDSVEAQPDVSSALLGAFFQGVGAGLANAAIHH